MVFARENIRIDAAPVKPPKTPHAPIAYNTEVRGEDALRLEYIHTLNTLAEGQGVMIVMSSPTMVPLPPMKVYTPVDALFIGDSGEVLQMLPKVVLGDMAGQIAAKGPIKAFLFLKGGEIAARGLQPHDLVAGSMFTPAPPVMQ